MDKESNVKPEAGRLLGAARGSTWARTTERLPEINVTVIGYAHRWIDQDYNPMGMRACFRGDDEWTSAAWHCWDAEFDAPDFWMSWPAAPATKTNLTTHLRVA